MLYSAIRIVLALAAAAMTFVIMTYSREEKGYTRRFASNDTGIWFAAGGVLVGLTLLLHFLPVENLLAGFAEPEDSFRYNHSETVLEITEYPDCAFVVAQMGNGEMTTHVLPAGKGGRWKLETVYNRRRDVTTFNYCMVERLYVPHSDGCFVIVTHSTEGNIADAPSNVIDSRNTQFTAVEYPDAITFYYGYVTDMDDDYTVHVDGEKIVFR